jgi:cytochrome c oxidase cbb3-type subunit 3
VAAADVVAALTAKRRIVLLDARPLSDWQRGHLPGALPVPFYDGIDQILPHLPADTPIVVYCACPHAASGKVVDALRAAGRPAAYVLDEGSLVWAARGYPIVVGGG